MRLLNLNYFKQVCIYFPHTLYIKKSHYDDSCQSGTTFSNYLDKNTVPEGQADIYGLQRITMHFHCHQSEADARP